MSKKNKHNHFWLERFLSCYDYGHLQFKKLDSGYPLFSFLQNIIADVSETVFCTKEEYRLPLFIGSQFGLHPRSNTIEGFFNGEKKVAVLSKSLMSGHVAGLTIYQLDASTTSILEGERITFFENKPFGNE